MTYGTGELYSTPGATEQDCWLRPCMGVWGSAFTVVEDGGLQFCGFTHFW